MFLNRDFLPFMKPVYMFIVLSLFFISGCGAKENVSTQKPLPQVTAGGAHTCFLSPENKIFCWGENAIKPARVEGFSSPAQSLAAGKEHTCALLTDGRVMCWGENDKGQLGNDTSTASAVPVMVRGVAGAKAICAGGRHTCAVLASGKMLCWGSNAYGELGDGTTQDSPRPVIVKNLESVKEAAAGELHTCAILSSGKIKCWGLNYHGELGTGTNIGPETCAIANVTYSCSTIAVYVVRLKDAKTLASGSRHTCAILSSGKIMCWGKNWDGELGHGKNVWIETCGSGLLVSPCSAAPVSVEGLSSSARELAAGGAHTCARLSSGKVQCWGSNDSGQLGNGTFKSSLHPVFVSGVTKAAGITAGDRHTCVRLFSGKVQCWGAGGKAQLVPL